MRQPSSASASASAFSFSSASGYAYAAIAAVTAIGLSIAGCGGGQHAASTTSATTSKPPLAEGALAGLLLKPAQIDSALGVTGTTVDKPIDHPNTDSPADVFPATYKFPDECLFIMGAAEEAVYKGSGNTAVRGESVVAPRQSGSDDPTPKVIQAVVLFPSADQANAFFTASSRHWSACANRQDTVGGEGDSAKLTWKVGAVSNATGVLSTIVDLSLGSGAQSMTQSCQRALTVRNNVVIDTAAYRKDPGNVAVDVAEQIAGNVDTQ